MAYLPVDGDVLIRSRDGSHYLSIVPHADRVSFGSLDRAIFIAQAVALSSKGVEVWHEKGELLLRITEPARRAKMASASLGDGAAVVRLRPSSDALTSGYGKRRT